MRFSKNMEESMSFSRISLVVCLVTSAFFHQSSAAAVAYDGHALALAIGPRAITTTTAPTATRCAYFLKPTTGMTCRGMLQTYNMTAPEFVALNPMKGLWSNGTSNCWGFRTGSSDNYCLIRTGGPDISTDGKCGPTKGGKVCPGSSFGGCCSAAGQCGSGYNYCGIGNCREGNCWGDQEGYSLDGNCGTRANEGRCGGKFGVCCSILGKCGNGTSYCGENYCIGGACIGLPISSTTRSSTTTTRSTTTSSKTTSSTSKTSTRTATTTQSVHTTPTPSPIQSGTAANCNKWYYASPDDFGNSCSRIAGILSVLGFEKVANLTTADLVRWNPGCSTFQSGYYYCVTTTDYVPQPCWGRSDSPSSVSPYSCPSVS